jgi:hypothetical protein
MYSQMHGAHKRARQIEDGTGRGDAAMFGYDESYIEGPGPDADGGRELEMEASGARAGAGTGAGWGYRGSAPAFKRPMTAIDGGWNPTYHEGSSSDDQVATEMTASGVSFASATPAVRQSGSAGMFATTDVASNRGIGISLVGTLGVRLADTTGGYTQELVSGSPVFVTKNQDAVYPLYEGASYSLFTVAQVNHLLAFHRLSQLYTQGTGSFTPFSVSLAIANATQKIHALNKEHVQFADKFRYAGILKSAKWGPGTAAIGVPDALTMVRKGIEMVPPFWGESPSNSPSVGFTVSVRPVMSGKIMDQLLDASPEFADAAKTLGVESAFRQAAIPAMIEVAYLGQHLTDAQAAMAVHQPGVQGLLARGIIRNAGNAETPLGVIERRGIGTLRAGIDWNEAFSAPVAGHMIGALRAGPAFFTDASGVHNKGVLTVATAPAAMAADLLDTLRVLANWYSIMYCRDEAAAVLAFAADYGAVAADRDAVLQLLGTGRGEAAIAGVAVGTVRARDAGGVTMLDDARRAISFGNDTVATCQSVVTALSTLADGGLGNSVPGWKASVKALSAAVLSQCVAPMTLAVVPGDEASVQTFITRAIALCDVAAAMIPSTRWAQLVHSVRILVAALSNTVGTVHTGVAPGNHPYHFVGADCVPAQDATAAGAIHRAGAGAPFTAAQTNIQESFWKYVLRAAAIELVPRLCNVMLARFIMPLVWTRGIGNLGNNNLPLLACAGDLWSTPQRDAITRGVGIAGSTFDGLTIAQVYNATLHIQDIDDAMAAELVNLIRPLHLLPYVDGHTEPVASRHTEDRVYTNPKVILCGTLYTGQNLANEWEESAKQLKAEYERLDGRMPGTCTGTASDSFGNMQQMFVETSFVGELSVPQELPVQ